MPSTDNLTLSMLPSLSDAIATTETADPATISSPSAGVAKLMTGELFPTGGSGSGCSGSRFAMTSMEIVAIAVAPSLSVVTAVSS